MFSPAEIKTDLMIGRAPKTRTILTKPVDTRPMKDLGPIEDHIPTILVREVMGEVSESYFSGVKRFCDESQKNDIREEHTGSSIVLKKSAE